MFYYLKWFSDTNQIDLLDIRVEAMKQTWTKYAVVCYNNTNMQNATHLHMCALWSLSIYCRPLHMYKIMFMWSCLDL